jgi:hypothetical protein
METPTPTNSKPQAPLALLSQLTNELAANRPGFQTTEFLLVAFSVIAIIVFAALGKIPPALALPAASMAGIGYGWLRNNRKGDRETAMLGLVNTFATSFESLNASTGLNAALAMVAPVSTITVLPEAPGATPGPGTLQKTVTLIALFCGLSFFFTGCGTQAGINAANVLESPAMAAIVQFGVDAGVNSLIASAGSKIPASAEAPLSQAADAAANGVATSILYAAAQALRTQQSTPQSASPSTLAAVTQQAGVSSAVAPVIASAVQQLAAKGVPADAANEAVAATLDATAAAKAPGSKAVIPLQSSAWHPSLRRHCGAVTGARGPDGAQAQTYFAPDDDTLSTILAFVNGTKRSLYIADYSFVWPDLTQALIALHRRGVDVELVLDKTQSAGPAEKPELAKLAAAGVPFQVGTCRTGHIMHHKFMIRDGGTAASGSVLAGSFNFTLTAAKENNFFDIIDDPARATKFLAQFRDIQGVMQAQAEKRKGAQLPPPFHNGRVILPVEDNGAQIVTSYAQ